MHFSEKVSKIKKGEFETKEEFKNRLANVDSLLAPMKTSDLYAFRIYNNNYSYLKLHYDADTQSYSPDYYNGGSYICDGILTYSCTIGKITRNERKYRGSNSYGASANVFSRSGLDFGIEISKKSQLFKKAFKKEEYSLNGEDRTGYFFIDKFPVPIEKARNIDKNGIGVLFVGRVTQASIGDGRAIMKEATISSPSSIFIQSKTVPFEVKKIVYYIVKTGEIIYKHSLDETVPEPVSPIVSKGNDFPG